MTKRNSMGGRRARKTSTGPWHRKNKRKWFYSQAYREWFYAHVGKDPEKEGKMK